MTQRIHDLVELAHGLGASDIHLVCGLPVKFRLDGRLEDIPADRSAPLTHQD